MLKMTHLSKVYRTEVVETYALRDFNINVNEGEFVAVTGPSGSGKTTFLTIAGLLETFTGGQYHLDGVEAAAPDVVEGFELQRHFAEHVVDAAMGAFVIHVQGFSAGVELGGVSVYLAVDQAGRPQADHGVAAELA